MSPPAHARRGPLVMALPGVLLGLLASAGAAAAQDPCAACGDTGAIACRVCDADLERGVVACSVGARCRACAGAGAVACTKCAAGTAAEADLARRREVAATWLREVGALFAAAGVAREPAACRTAHFDLLFAPGPIDGCPAKDVHAQLHVYGERLEALRSRARTALGLGEDDPASPDAADARFTVALVRDDLDCARLTAHLAGLEPQGLGVVAPERRAIVLRHDPRATRGDDGLQRLLAHTVAHLVTGTLRPVGSLDAAGHGWLDEGFAHWLEAEQPGEVCETFCHLERVPPPRRCFGGRWRPGVRELLEASQLPSLTELIGRDAADLEPRHHALAFALVDHLLRPTVAPITPGPIESQRALPAVVRAAKSGSAPADALRGATGLDVDVLDQRLRTWVKETYPRR